MQPENRSARDDEPWNEHGAQPENRSAREDETLNDGEEFSSDEPLKEGNGK